MAATSEGEPWHPACWLSTPPEEVVVVTVDVEPIKRKKAQPETSTRRNLSELRRHQFAPIRWAIEDLLPQGFAVLASKPKLGKSWMLLGWGLAVAAGGVALEKYSASPGDVLLLALEDSERRIQSRLEQCNWGHLDEEALSRFEYKTEFPMMDKGGIEELDKWLSERTRRLVIIDTFQRFRGPAPGKDKYGEDYKAAGQIQDLAKRHDVTIIVAHHVKKEASEDWVDSISGTQGIAGAADTLIALTKPRGKAEGFLTFTGRDIREGDLAVQFDEHAGTWSSLGDAAKWRTTQERREVLEALEALSDGDPVQPGAIAREIGKKLGVTSKLLQGLEKEGLVTKAAYGKYLPASLTPLEVVEPVEPPTSTTSTTSTGGEDQEIEFEEDDHPW
jgi:hypothetical protein